ncbi:MAG: glycoside hydrolase family 76 protein, partial [Patescibacteria group bacterium]|nr:glycoside hydrolase family 76 protein [Patescibacteria group bacterium]
MTNMYSDYADACYGALMENWYQCPISAGNVEEWFDNYADVWDDLAWWQCANALETVINYSNLRQVDDIADIISCVFNSNVGSYDGNFINNAYDDEAWWALAWIKAFERTKNTRYLSVAENIFNDMSSAWDWKCTGGIWWDKTRRDKNAIENELFFTLAARLYQKTLKGFYLDWAKDAWNWFNKSGLQGSDALINDGLDLTTCTNNGKTTYTYNQGVILGGLACMYEITLDMGYVYKARQIANATMTDLVKPKTSVLQEPCETTPGGCGNDGTQFKGIFIRYLSYLYQVENETLETPSDPRWVPKPSYETFFMTNADSIWNNARASN